MDSNKPILFYSSECQHSNKLLQAINNTSFINSLTLCSVDDLSINIPEFVQSVPTIYIPNQKRILTDNALMMFINTELSRGSKQQPAAPPQPQPQPQPQQQQQQQNSNLDKDDSSILAYHRNEMSAGFSDNYSFIEEDSKESNGFTHNYTFLEDNKQQQQQSNQPQNIQMEIPQLSSNKQNKGNMLDKAYEELMNSRNKDFIPMSQQRV